MIYRVLGVLAVFALLAYPLPPPPPVSKHGGNGNTQKDWDRETTCWRERGGKNRIIRPQESLVLYKSFNTLLKRETLVKSLIPRTTRHCPVQFSLLIFSGFLLWISFAQNQKVKWHLMLALGSTAHVFCLQGDVHQVWTFFSHLTSVADPGCSSEIPDPYFLHPFTHPSIHPTTTKKRRR